MVVEFKKCLVDLSTHDFPVYEKLADPETGALETPVPCRGRADHLSRGPKSKALALTQVDQLLPEHRQRAGPMSVSN